LHPENAGTPYEVLLGRLGAQEAERRGLLKSAAFQPLAVMAARLKSALPNIKG
jgi:hypothetical protein